MRRVSSINFIIGILIKIVELTSQSGDTAVSERVLSNLCSCLLESVACTLSSENQSCNSGDCWGAWEDMFLGDFVSVNMYNTNSDSFTLCPGMGIRDYLKGGALHAVKGIVLNNSYSISQSYQQAIAAFVDFIQYVVFDRDCNKNAFDTGCDECCTVNAGDYEDYMNARCRAATNNGNCVVCSSACRKWRRDDGYETALSVLYSLRCFFGLLGIDRGSQDKYEDQVNLEYNRLAEGLHSAYKNSHKGDKTGKTLKLYPDCAAPQFCCSTARAFNLDCCNPNQESLNVINQVPSLDRRLPTDQCGSATNSQFGLTVSVSEFVNPATNCYPLAGNWSNGTFTVAYAGSPTQNIRSGINTCVLSAPCCNTVSCSTDSCYDSGETYFSSYC